ncbi:MAG: 2,4-dihydroxyhept-2-ene-1,7-dioic acid aldolase [bacterium]|nr:2,4-dihydroxyhept-2-ene-1,7-dioic acid aldolase [bacterium]
MEAKTLKRKLKNKELTIGSWLSFSYPSVCEMMVKSGFQWLVIDMEHTAIDYCHAQELIRIIDLAGCVPLVRVGGNDPLIIKRVMDAGAHGVVVPMINTKEEAERAVKAAYYPPFGNRGVGLSRAQDYGLGFKEYKDWAEKETVVIVQIEHIEGVRNLEDILSVDGVDGFIIGPYDLSGSLDLPGQFDHPSVKEALQKVERIMKDSSKPGGFHVVHSDRDGLMKRVEEGYKFIAYGDDMVFLAEKLDEEKKFLQKELPSATRS